MIKKQDPRTIRSQKWIKDALLRLMIEERFEDLFVQDIMREAEMNRATFYKHFRDKHQLLHNMIDTLFEQLIISYDSIEEEFDFVKFKHPHPRIVHFFTFVKRHHVTFYTLLNKQKIGYFRERLERFIQESSFDILNVARHYQHEVKFSQPIVQMFITSIVIGTVTWWLEERCPFEPYKAAQYITEMIDRGIYS